MYKFKCEDIYWSSDDVGTDSTKNFSLPQVAMQLGTLLQIELNLKQSKY